MPDRFVVVVSRVTYGDCEVVVLGPFRQRERADARAATVKRLAAKYDDDEALLHVAVEPIRSGSSAAADAMAWLYDGPGDGDYSCQPAGTAAVTSSRKEGGT